MIYQPVKGIKNDQFLKTNTIKTPSSNYDG